MKQIAFIIILALCFCPVLFAADNQDDEALFGSDDETDVDTSITEITQSDTTANIDTLLLTNNGLVWSGAMRFNFQSSWMWVPTSGSLFFNTIVDNFTTPTTSTFNPELGFTLAFDARPDANFRVMGKMNITYPLTEEPVIADIFHITELFADYNWSDVLFFRAGKQTIKWGAGYYFSPADIINITPIDPENPEADREGPLAVKVNYPFGLNNLYLYVIAKDIDDPAGLIFAPKLEFLIGDAEIGLGAIYRPDWQVRPRIMTTATFKVLDVSMFGEGVFSYGSERTYIRESANPLVLETYMKNETPIFDATLGFRYSYDNDDWNLHLSLLGQYLYNGDGYTSTELLRADTALMLPLFAGPNPSLTRADLIQPAQHYGVASLSVREIGGSDISLSCMWMGSIDGTGSIIPGLSLAPNTNLNYSLRIPFTYGVTGGEFTPMGTMLAPELTLHLFEKTKITVQFPFTFQKDDDNNLLCKSGQISLGLALENSVF